MPETADFDPNEFEDDDDFETLDEEERMAAVAGDDDDDVADLEAEANLSIEELMARYGQEVSPSAPSLHTVCDRPPAGPRICGWPLDGWRSSSRAGCRRVGEPDQGQAAAAGLGGRGGRRYSQARPPRLVSACQAAATEAEAAPMSAAAAAAEGGAAAASAEADGGMSGSEDEGGFERRYSRLTVLNYFNPEYHHEEVEVETGVAEKKSIRVGSEYQCEVPPGTGGAPTAVSGDLLWCPPLPEVMAEATVAELCRARAAGALKPGRLIELALNQLYACGYGGSRVGASGESTPIDAGTPWSLSEIAQFEDGLVQHGKDFRAIATTLDSRTRAEAVEFYYDWKTTEMYDQFVACSGGFKGKIRRKHLFEPGRPVEGFAHVPEPEVPAAEPAAVDLAEPAAVDLAEPAAAPPAAEEAPVVLGGAVL